jgi:hypothetical protein
MGLGEYVKGSELDWTNFVLAVLGIVLTVVGFWIALVQLRKTKTAAEAAASAATIGTVRIRYNQLLMITPQLQTLETELDTAFQQNDYYGAERILLRWRQLAASAHGVLGQMGDGYLTLVESLEKTRGNAIATKGKLSEASASQSRTVSTVAAGVRKEISVVNDELGSVVSRLATEVPTEDGVSH